MAGVPAFVENLGWWAVFLFLFGVVLTRAQGTYWLGRWARQGTDTAAASAHPRAASLATKLSGPGADSSRRYIERWGFVGIPASFLTIGFQTMVNATAGFIRMRWDLYTVAMIPGCLAWAAVYTLVTFSLVEAWTHSPALMVAGVIAIVSLVALAFVFTRRHRSGDSSAHTPR